jgi:hypothetical protein
MNAVLEKRLEGLSRDIAVSADRANVQRHEDAKKADMAKFMIGQPYYWDKYSGFVQKAKNPTQVEVCLVHQVTGCTVYWTLDAYKVYDHLLKIKDFFSWKEYYEDRKLAFAISTEEMLIGFGCPENEIQEKMIEYCSKFKIPYKSFCKELRA